MVGRTISFPKGDGSLSHNNREFIAKNVCEERTPWNRTYIMESLTDAYKKCFGEAVREYNEGQKRNDRKIWDYKKKIENSDNREKVFYENIVQLGTKDDTPVVDENGNLTDAAQEAINLLDEYARTFQARNPNLYLFNCVMHLDEATPHLHIDYIPVANGYKQGMKTRNSLSKALQQMGFEKGKGRYQNEAIEWEAREREYLTGLCQERGIEVVIKGDRRDNLTLPEYKAAMRKVEGLEQEYKKMDEKLGSLKSKQKVMERNVRVYEEEPKWQLAAAPLFMGAKEYREKVAVPLVQKLKKKIFDLTLRCIDAIENEKKYKEKVNELLREVNNLANKVREQRETIDDLRDKVQILADVREYFGADKIEEIRREAKQRKQMVQLPKKHEDRDIAI